MNKPFDLCCTPGTCATHLVPRTSGQLCETSLQAFVQIRKLRLREVNWSITEVVSEGTAVQLQGALPLATLWRVVHVVGAANMCLVLRELLSTGQFNLCCQFRHLLGAGTAAQFPSCLFVGPQDRVAVIVDQKHSISLLSHLFVRCM